MRQKGVWTLQGTTLGELVVVLALVGVLLTFGAARFDSGSAGIRAVRGELKACLEQAFLRAQAQGSDVKVTLQAQGARVPGSGPDPGPVAPLALPRGLRWGLPEHGIPFPPGMDPPTVAQRTGQAHASVTFTPRHTAQGAVWFLTDEKDALCLRLSGHGQVQLLHWRHRDRRWTRF